MTTKLTVEAYTAAIPKCCAAQTYEEHADMLLCWGLSSSIQKGYTMDCGCCDMNINSTPSKINIDKEY